MPTAPALARALPSPLAAFPWLAAEGLRGDLGQIGSSSGPVSAQIASLVRRCCPAVPLNVLFPTIGPDVDLMALGWSSRHRNVLLRRELAYGRDLARMTAAELEATWSVGPGSTEAILARLAEAALEAA